MEDEQLSSLRNAAKDLFQCGLEAVNPFNAVKKALNREKNKIIIGLGTSKTVTYDIEAFERIIVVGMGKATALMAKAVDGILGNVISEGCVVVKYGHTAELETIRLLEAGHPLPDENGLQGAREIARLVEEAAEKDLIIFLISGGGSALLPLPATGVELVEKQNITSQLLKCGADIQEINTIRKHISIVKGGQLARLAYPATIVSMILSDVVGDRLDTIASGPTVPDATTFSDALKIVNKYDLLEKIPQSIRKRLEAGVRGEITDTPKDGDKVFKKAHNIIVGSNNIALQAIAEQAKKIGLNAIILSSAIEGEAKEVAKVLSAVAKEMTISGNPIPAPACVISGGETTVTIEGKGKGGRNQELGLSAAIAIDGLDNLVILSGGTDGSDGPTDAAGAIVDGNTIERARQQRIDAHQFLRNNDAYNFLKQTHDLLITGPTNTNVMDIHIIMKGK
jgi:hydroxypyruvate reductase